MLFSRFKTKLSLIDDYIYITRACQYYNNIKNSYKDLGMFFCGICEYGNQLLKLYEQAFLKLKMLDVPFEIVKSQLEASSDISNAEKCRNSIEELQKYRQNLQILQKIHQKLPQKLKKLSFNEVEINFILKNT